MRDSEELVRLIHDAMLAAGIDGEAVYRQLGCDATLFENLDRRCPHDYQSLFWQAVEDVTQDKEVCLQFCPHLPVFRGDALEYLLLSSPTLRDGILTASQYRRLISDALHIDIVNEPGYSRIVLQGSGYTTPQRRHTEICFVHGIAHTLRSVTQGTFKPLRVQFALQPRRPLADYEQVFGCPVTFGAGANEIWVDSDVLDKPSEHGSPNMLAVHTQCAAQQLAFIELQDTIDHVRDALTERTSSAFIGLDRTLEDVAATIDMSPRTLRSQLAEAGTSFRALKKQARMMIARQLLCETDVAVEKIAAMSGFSEAAAFYRAFRGWTGHTPQQYRDQLIPQAQRPKVSRS